MLCSDLLEKEVDLWLRWRELRKGKEYHYCFIFPLRVFGSVCDTVFGKFKHSFVSFMKHNNESLLNPGLLYRVSYTSDSQILTLPLCRSPLCLQRQIIGKDFLPSPASSSSSILLPPYNHICIVVKGLGEGAKETSLVTKGCGEPPLLSPHRILSLPYRLSRLYDTVVVTTEVFSEQLCLGWSGHFYVRDCLVFIIGVP